MKTLTLLFLVQEGNVLLAMKKRGFGAGRWNGVGGKLEPGETVEQALVRECQEEIGVTPTVYHKAAEITFDEYMDGEPAQLHVEAFVCQKWQGEPGESEEMRPQWFKTDELPLADMWPDDEFWLPQVLGSKLIRASFALDKTDMITGKNVEIVATFRSQ